MELSQSRTVKILAVLLLLTAISQPIYTALFYYAPDFNRHVLWGLEGFIFVLLAAFAGSALVMAKRYTLGFSAIAFSAVLNVVQVGVGLRQFTPFREAAEANPDLGGLAFAVVTFSFFGYNAAKILLGLAAVDFGMARLKDGAKVLGGAAVLWCNRLCGQHLGHDIRRARLFPETNRGRFRRFSDSALGYLSVQCPE